MNLNSLLKFVVLQIIFCIFLLLSVLEINLIAAPKSYPYKVTTTVGMVGDIVKNIVGEKGKVKNIIGEGVEVMQSMIDRKHIFDLIFIDADKNNYPNYYELSLSLLSSNGIIIIDNMLWHGDVVDLKKNDSQTSTIRDLNKKIQNDSRVEFSLLPLSDGLSFIRKK